MSLGESQAIILVSVLLHLNLLGPACENTGTLAPLC